MFCQLIPSSLDRIGSGGPRPSSPNLLETRDEQASRAPKGNVLWKLICIFRRTRLQLAFRAADVKQRCEGWISISRGSKEPGIPALANLQYFQRNQVSNRSICSCIEYLPQMESKLGDGSLITKTSSSGNYSQLERSFRSRGSISHASLFSPSKESLRL